MSRLRVLKGGRVEPEPQGEPSTIQTTATLVGFIEFCASHAGMDHDTWLAKAWLDGKPSEHFTKAFVSVEAQATEVLYAAMLRKAERSLRDVVPLPASKRGGLR